MAIKKDLKIYSIDPLQLIFGIVNGYFEEINRNKYLTEVPTDESKEKIKRYEKLWIKIRELIRSINKNSDDYDGKYMKIKFNSHDNLPLNKTIEIPIVSKVVWRILHENNKYYPQVFRDECLYKIEKWYYDRIDFLEGTDVNKTNASKECDNCCYWYFLIYSFKFQPMSAIDVMIY